MPYVAPSTVVAGQTYSAANHNIIVNDIIDHEDRLDTVQNAQYPARNVLVNGAMQFSQRGTSVSGISSGAAYRTVDRWMHYVSSAGTWTNAVSADAPAGSGFRNSVRLTCATAVTSLTASAEKQFLQRLEGQTLQHIKKGTASAQQLTLSFWVKGSTTGTYIAELADEDNSRRVAASYTISAANTWEQKTITFPADTTGVLDNDNANSLTLAFWLAAGSDFTSGTLATTWAASVNANRAVGQTNLAAAVNNYWQITGVQLEPGSQASPFEFVRYDDELRRCQRYYYRLSGSTHNYLGVGYCFGTGTTTPGARRFTMKNPVDMRGVPVVSFGGTLALLSGNLTNRNFSSFGSQYNGPSFCSFEINTSVNTVNGEGMMLIIDSNSANDFIQVSAEL